MGEHLESLLGRLDEASMMRTALVGSSEVEEVLRLSEFFDLKTIVSLMIVLGGRTITFPKAGKFLKACKLASMAAMIRTGRMTIDQVPKPERASVNSLIRTSEMSDAHFSELTTKLINQDDQDEICRRTTKTTSTPTRSFISQHT